MHCRTTHVPHMLALSFPDPARWRTARLSHITKSPGCGHSTLTVYLQCEKCIQESKQLAQPFRYQAFSLQVMQGRPNIPVEAPARLMKLQDLVSSRRCGIHVNMMKLLRVANYRECAMQYLPIQSDSNSSHLICGKASHAAWLSAKSVLPPTVVYCGRAIARRSEKLARRGLEDVKTLSKRGQTG